jgi:hypothetical protein
VADGSPLEQARPQRAIVAPYAVRLHLSPILAATAHRYHPEAHTLHELVRSIL